MKTLIRPLALAAALGVAGVIGTSYLFADEPPGGAGAKPPEAPAKADPPAKPQSPEAKPEPPPQPVKVTDARVEMKTAVTPKPLSAAVKKGLEYLTKTQQEDGGWAQGGGWRTNSSGGGRVEGKEIEDPSDIGNTCFALLALIRAGSTPTVGEYKDAVRKGLRFVLGRVEKSDKDSLYVTDVRGTQLQSKIGPYVDTFLANLVLAELRGKAGEDESRLVAGLEKTMTKIVKHQTAEGGFAGNGGWAPVLSLMICNKGVARAKLNGVTVDDRFFARAFEQSKVAAGQPAPAAAAAAGPRTEASGALAATPPPVAGPGGAAPRGSALPAGEGRGTGGVATRGGVGGGFGGAGMSGDAGVSLYRIGQGAGNSQDVINGLRVDGEKARQVLKDAKSTKEDKTRAEQKLDELKKAEGENAKVQEDLGKSVKNQQFVAGFGSNGGEEFLSFLNISEALVVKGGKDWEEWDQKMIQGMEKAQDKDGSWAGHHCITGKTFCTAGALLVLMADRTPFPAEVLLKKDDTKNEKKPEPEPEPKKE